MSAGFALLCIGSVVVSSSIVWILYGPTKGARVVAVPRASSGVPEYIVPKGSGATYQPEAVFAVEDQYRRAVAAQVAQVVPPAPVARRAPSGPPPLPPRTRMARGSAPPVLREQTVPEANEFADDSATHVGWSSSPGATP